MNDISETDQTVTIREIITVRYAYMEENWFIFSFIKINLKI